MDVQRAHPPAAEPEYQPELRDLRELSLSSATLSQEEILSLFSPEQQALLEERRRLLSTLAYFIGKDFEIPVELNRPGAGWHWDFGANKIRVDPIDLLTKPLDYCRAVTCHEGGHRRITRADFIPPEVWNQPGFSFMMNANEDPRNDSFIAEAYPKYREQITLTYRICQEAEAHARERADKHLGYRPRFVEAGFQYIGYWFKEFCGETPSLEPDLRDDVREVVERTLPAASESWRYYPSRAEADSGEATIEAYARIFYQINRDRVWPEFKKLVEKDLEDQRAQELLKELSKQRGGQSGGAAGQQGGAGAPSQADLDALARAIEEAARNGTLQISPGGGAGGGRPLPLDALSPEARRSIQEAIGKLPPEARSELERRAREALRDLERAIGEEISGKLNPPASRQPGGAGQPGDGAQGGGAEEGEASSDGSERGKDGTAARRSEPKPKPEESKDFEAYRENRKSVAPQIERFASRARAIFKERRRHDREARNGSGASIDIRTRINELGKGVPAHQSRAWQQRVVPREKDFAIALLVDLSGSMSGSKVEKALRGAIVVAEPLKRLGIKNGVFGFNTKLYTYKDFNETLSPPVRAKMGHMIKETRSQNSYCTDDGWALDQVSGWLEREKAHQKFIIILTDGESAPSQQHSSPELQRDAVVQRIRKTTNQVLIAYGVGPNTGFVNAAYPNGEGNVDENLLPDKLADLLEDIIKNYNRFRR